MNGLQLAVAESALSTYLLALARCAAFVSISPPFNARNVSSRARVALAVALALPMSAAVPEDGATALGSPTMWLAAVAEVLVGLTLGFLVLIAVSTIHAVGELLDLVGGFTLTASLDPMLLVQTSVMGRLHQLTAAVILFATDGHLMVLHGLAHSMQIGTGRLLDPQQVAEAVTGDVAQLFASALQIAAPVIAAMLIADAALGLLTRAAPAINPFALSFPLKILFTLLLAGLVLTRLPEALGQTVEHAVITMLDLTAGIGG